jgi:cytochrome c oxidase subunit 3
MSTTVNVAAQAGEPIVKTIDQGRGKLAMYMVISTELALFVSLFCSYFFLGNNKNRWMIDQPPKFALALVMAAVLLSSSLVLMWGERQVKLERYFAARLALAGTIAIGLVFLTIQSFEYLEHWKSLTPYSDSYGSIFYVITSFHAAHVIVGLLMLSYVLFIPRYGPKVDTPYRPYEVAAIYWHFVDIVWIFIVLILYVIPNYIVYVH